VEAGVPHVICIDQKETILDKAASEFSKWFYDEVFDTYNDICTAYQLAKDKVKKNHGKFHADKIKLLLNKDTHGSECPESNDPRLTLHKGELN